jgi:hypothetical protein
VPAIQTSVSYPAELSATKIRFESEIFGWFGPAFSSRTVGLSNEEIPKSTRDYSRYIAWQELCVGPMSPGVEAFSVRAVARGDIAVSLAPLADQNENPVLQLWSYAVTFRAGGAWHRHLVKRLIIDDRGRILDGIHQDPLGWRPGRAGTQAGHLVVDTITGVEDVTAEGVLTRFVYSPEQGMILPSGLPPVKMPVGYHWDPGYKDPYK